MPIGWGSYELFLSKVHFSYTTLKGEKHTTIKNTSTVLNRVQDLRENREGMEKY